MEGTDCDQEDGEAQASQEGGHYITLAVAGSVQRENDGCRLLFVKSGQYKEKSYAII